jgi:hypothetical protein
MLPVDNFNGIVANPCYLPPGINMYLLFGFRPKIVDIRQHIFQLIADPKKNIMLFGISFHGFTTQ